VGRAARNLGGAAIMYADSVTGSMQRALDEMDRRRRVQQASNETHGITPQGIRKSVQDIMDGAYAARPGRAKLARVAEKAGKYEDLSPESIIKKIAKLEQDMYRCARDLEFETAAKIRDEIARLREYLVQADGLTS
jgi:excinuclease ABC subunit B